MSLKRTQLWLLSIVAFCCVGMVAASGFLVARLHEQNWWVEHTLRVIQESQQALTCLLDCETAARGYMLTRDSAYLEPYETCYKHVAGHLEALRSLTADNPQQQAEMPVLFKLADEKIRRSQQLIALASKVPLGDQRITSMIPDRQIMDNFRATIGKVTDREQKLLQQRAAEADKLRTLVYVCVGILGVLLLAALTRAAISTWREGAAREQAAKSQSDLRNAQALFDATVANVKDYAIFLLDRDGTVRTWNSGAERINGYIADEIIGKSSSQFYPEEARRANHPETELQEALKNGQYEEEGWRVRKDGTRFWASVSITPIMGEDGQPSGFIKVTRDLSARKAAEEKLKLYAQELEIARDEAIRASALKGQFVANVSHEVRTPLSGIVGLTELLTVDPTLPEEARDTAVRIFGASKQLLTVLNDILNFSKLEAGRVAVESVAFSVKSLLKEVQALFETQSRQKGLAFDERIESSVPDSVIGDPTKVSQSLMNLVSNAIKFTARGGIEVAAEVDGNMLRFSVTDTGIGIPPESQANLFAPFSQADASTTRRFGGTGLGLSIVKQYVELMGGQTGFITQENRGSTFWFTVPLQIPGGGSNATA